MSNGVYYPTCSVLTPASCNGSSGHAPHYNIIIFPNAVLRRVEAILRRTSLTLGIAMDPVLDVLIIIVILPFVALQLCMVGFLLVARRNDEMLRNGFFTIFMAISIADCIYMTTVGFPLRTLRSNLHLHALDADTLGRKAEFRVVYKTCYLPAWTYLSQSLVGPS